MNITLINESKDYLIDDKIFIPPKRILYDNAHGRIIGRTSSGKVFKKCLTFENNKWFVQLYVHHVPYLLFHERQSNNTSISNRTKRTKNNVFERSLQKRFEKKILCFL